MPNLINENISVTARLIEFYLIAVAPEYVARIYHYPAMDSFALFLSLALRHIWHLKSGVMAGENMCYIPPIKIDVDFLGLEQHRKIEFGMIRSCA
jgi:hypothetical protein